MKRLVSYIRVSTKQQGISGLGLESQQAIINNYYPDIEKEFKEVHSAGTSDRPILKEAMEYCKANKCWLVVAKVDRLSRVTEELLQIWNELDQNVHFCDIPGQGKVEKFALTLFGSIADRERELIKIRTKAALDILKAKRGEWRVSKGFTDDQRNNGKAAVNAKARSNSNNRQAANIINDKYKLGMNWTDIAVHLNEYNHKTSKGCKFSSVQVKRLYLMFFANNNANKMD